MSSEVQAVIDLTPVQADAQPDGGHGDYGEEDIHLPPSSIAPLIVAVGATFLLTGVLFKPFLVLGLGIALFGGLKLARFPEVDLHPHFLMELDSRKLGMWTFLSSEVMFFTGLIGSFIYFKVLRPEAFEAAHEVLSLPLATLGTSVLIVSSFAVVMGLEGLQSNSRRVFLNWMGLAILLGVTFVSIQAFEWAALMHEGIKADDIFGTAFFATTGFHGLHVLVGVGWLVLLMLRAARGEYSADNFLGVEMFGLYWHFVDVVWIVLFTVIYLIH